MTERQEQLINYLLNQLKENEAKYVSKEEIQQNLLDENGFNYYIDKPSSRKGDSYRLEITKDCDVINRSTEQECSYLIISNSKGYKIATREEAIVWAENQKKSIAKRCIKRNNMLRKYKLDGQFSLENVEVKTFL